MGRSPCCEKLGVKKGPWSEEEDQILVSFIKKNGHGNWRSLPKRCGLLRCGKSCRLRWTNYLRPDIKRGNFTREEEDTIIRLHAMLGNRWSAIAAELPGRTDNEIKNVWHTHLKKRLGCATPTSSSETGNEYGSINASLDKKPQLSGGFPSEDFSPSDWPDLPELDESIWSEEFTVPWLQSPIEQANEEDDMDFWLNMLIQAGDIQHF